MIYVYCGSGKKYKKCCLVSDDAGEQPEPLPWQPSRKPPAIAKPSEATISRLLSDNPILPICTKGFSRPVDAENPPPVDSVKLLPVEVSLHYTYREAYGVAEVTYCFPGGHVFLLEHGVPILNDDLKPGMKVQLKGGRSGLITKVILNYEPPDPPKEVKDRSKATRVMGIQVGRWTEDCTALEALTNDPRGYLKAMKDGHVPFPHFLKEGFRIPV